MPHARVRMLRTVAVGAVLALVLAACGSSKKEASSGSTNKVVKIGFIAPISGDLSALGLGMRNSVDLAIKQANQANKVKGWTIQLAAEDDTAKADVGAQAATKLSSDAAVVGVVGTLNSSVAQQVTPILDTANIVQISPANTNDTLTRGQDFNTNPVRPHKNYFRVATLDSLQGGFAADYVYKTAGIKTAATINDKKTYGQGLAEQFTKQFTADGGKVVAAETINPGDKDFGAVLSKIKPSNPGMIFYGGEYPEASLISSQAKTAGLKVPLMGGDGIYDKTYITVAGAAGEGDLATSVGAPAEELDSAKQFVADYKAANYPDPFSAYGALAYDAANVIINGIAKVLSGKAGPVNDQVRQDVIKAVQATDQGGATGSLKFDKYGDTLSKVLTVYKVESGAWKSVKVGEFGK
jgi:branched-chain amino acid transport system substrate-binding protein